MPSGIVGSQEENPGAHFSKGDVYSQLDNKVYNKEHSCLTITQYDFT